MDGKSRLLLISGDSTLTTSLADAVRGEPDLALAAHGASIEAASGAAALAGAAIVLVEIHPNRREHLVALQSLMNRSPGAAFIVLLSEPCSDAVQRWFMQIRVSDYLHKPLVGADILAACRRLLRGHAEPPSDQAQVTCFIPAAGGVGNTTLAVEAALQILGGAGDKDSTALVDLDLHSDACADYLDLEPRLDLVEIGEAGERLDAQLLEAMTSRHSSGLALIAAPSLVGQVQNLERAAVLRLLDTVATRYRRVVVDLPRMWHAWTDDILVGADRVYIVTDMTVPGVRFARRMADQLNGRLALKTPVSVIVNRVEQRFLFGSGLRRADVAQALQDVFAGGVPNNYNLVREAIDQGVALESLKSGNNISTALRRILFAQSEAKRSAS